MSDEPQVRKHVTIMLRSGRLIELVLRDITVERRKSDGRLIGLEWTYVDPNDATTERLGYLDLADVSAVTWRDLPDGELT